MKKRRFDPDEYLRQRAEHVERIAVALADALETAAPDEPVYTDVVIDAFERGRQIVEERRAAVKQQQHADMEAAAAQWRSERGLLTAHEYMTRHGLTKAQFAVAAVYFLRGYAHPSGMYAHGAQMSKWDRAYPDRALTEDELQQVARGVLLTANQAAEYLDITRAEFDKRKKKRGLQAAEYRRGNAAYPYALYRLIDVDGLKDT